MRKVKYLLRGRLIFCILFLLAVIAGGIALAVILPQLLAPIAAAERLFALGAALFIANSAIPAESKARKILLLMLPWLGLLLCLFLVKRTPPRKTPTPIRSFEDGTANDISALARQGCGLSGCFTENAEYFPTGRALYDRLLPDLESAEHEILFDFYLLSHGIFLDSVLSILEKKAKTGVDVQLIYDDFGSTFLPKKFPAQLRARGIKAKVFHPIRAFSFRRLNRRDHRKLIVIDRKIAYTGGVNLADEYIGEVIRFGHWKDTGIRLTGEAAERFSALFRGRTSDETEKNGSPCVVFGDTADKRERLGEEIYFRLISSARQTLYLCTPYLAPSEKLLTALKSTARTADVRILIPHIPDKKSVFSLTRSYARELIKAGVQVREYSAGFLHAKNLTSDGKYVLIGSYNLDERSLSYQAECGVFLLDETLCRTVERDFLTSWQTSDRIPKASIGEKITAFFLRLFQPLF